MAGLWDYDEEDAAVNETSWSSPSSSSGDEGPSKKRKRQGSNKDGAAKRQETEAICLDIDDPLASQRSNNSDSDFEITIPSQKQKSEPSVPDVPSISGRERNTEKILQPSEAFLSAEMRQALERQRKLAEKLQSVNQEDLEDLDPIDTETTSYKIRPYSMALGVGPGLTSSSLYGGAVAAQLAEQQVLLDPTPVDLQPQAAAEQPAADEGKVTVVCVCSAGELKVKIRKTDTFGKLLDAFCSIAAKKGWTVPDRSKMRIDFDGEKQGLDGTLDSVDIDDDERVDISWK